EGLPLAAAVAALPAKHLLRARRRAAAAVPPGGPLDAKSLTIEKEVELDQEAFAVLVDQLDKLRLAAAVLLEEGKRHGIEDGRLAAAIETGQHPQRRAIKGDLLLVLVTEEPLQLDALRDHASTSRRISSARDKTASRTSSG